MVELSLGFEIGALDFDGNVRVTSYNEKPYSEQFVLIVADYRFDPAKNDFGKQLPWFP